MREPTQKSLPPGFRLPSDIIRTIADQFPQPNAVMPRRPEHYFLPIIHNIFSEGDRATLAGKMICELYDTLIQRTTVRKPTYPEEYDDLGVFAFDAFNEYVSKVLNARRQRRADAIEFSLERQKGADAFHFDGDTTVTRSFLFYFNRSMSHWQHPRDQIVRAYITLDQLDLRKTYMHFTDLCLILYDADIDFSTKCCSPYGQARRMDNVVVYIAESHRERASSIIKQFMTDRKLGTGHMLAAAPSAQGGLSWAYEPTDTEIRLWQEVSGSSRRTSFNIVATMYALPFYLDAMVLACRKAGDTTSANTYKAEAERIRALFKKYQTVHN